MRTARNSLTFILAATVSLSTPPGNSQTEPLKIRQGTELAKLRDDAMQNAVFAAAAAPIPGAKVKIPAWLRAHYRRNHADFLRIAAAPSDPTGGYPLALETLYAWMLRHQDLKSSSEPAERARATSVNVGENTRISGNNNTPRSESDIRINAEDPKQIIAASNNIGSGSQAQFFSSNGGTSWGQTSLPLLSGDSLHSDPTVDWDSQGNAWATTMGINAATTVLQMRAYKSIDGGKNWIFDATFSGDQTNTDKQMMCVDRSSTSQFRDSIYVVWHNGRPAFANHRTSAGWQVPVQLSGAETTGTAIGSDVTTNAAGDVFAVWPDTGSRKLFLVSSKDGGATFSTPQQIGQTIASFQIIVPAFADRAALVGVSIAAFKTQNRDDVYVSWLDLAGGDGCNAADSEPGTDVASDCKSRVWFARSADGGKTWSETARKINDQPNHTDQFNQKLAIDPETGVLGVTYYNTGSNADRKKTNVMFQFSQDAGATWSAPTKVTTATTDETAVSADNGNQYGDYNGLSAAKGVFALCWTDRRSGTSESIFTARITLKQNAAGVYEAKISQGPEKMKND
jgi:hypothetical protein